MLSIYIKFEQIKSGKWGQLQLEILSLNYLPNNSKKLCPDFKILKVQPTFQSKTFFCTEIGHDKYNNKKGFCLEKIFSIWKFYILKPV